MIGLENVSSWMPADVNMLTTGYTPMLAAPARGGRCQRLGRILSSAAGDTDHVADAASVWAVYSRLPNALASYEE